MNNKKKFKTGDLINVFDDDDYEGIHGIVVDTKPKLPGSITVFLQNGCSLDLWREDVEKENDC